MAKEIMGNFIGYLTNCFIVGTETSRHADGSWCRNRLCISFAGYSITLIQDPSIINAPLVEIQGKTLVTTEVHVQNLEYGKFEDLLRKLEGLAKLLSLITVSEVSLCGWDYPSASPSSKHWAVVSQASFFRPLIETTNGNIIKEFLEESWPGYFINEHTRELPVAISYFVTAEVREMPMELKLAAMFILFENLKSTYAKDFGYPYKDGWYRNHNGGKWSFKPLLSEMFKSVGMSPDLDKIKKLRNEIIHSGISQLTFSQQQEIYAALRDISIEYFMRLLGFSGHYHLYSDFDERYSG